MTVRLKGGHYVLPFALQYVVSGLSRTVIPGPASPELITNRHADKPHRRPELVREAETPRAGEVNAALLTARAPFA